ncbi:MAG: nucleotidyltransferase domain-containing protein [Syntrophaceae bacterium]|nr:nucleotidyltransferase domain-containing protein [Syntrophaceae bacterium]
MEEKYFQAGTDRRRAVTEDIRAFLDTLPEVLFAYLYGSFTREERFRDVDVAVYLKNPIPSPLQAELRLEAELAERIEKYPVELRVLNQAPLSFRYRVIKEGIVLVIRDEDFRCKFVESTLRDYFDFAPFRKAYLQETIGLGI